MTTHNTVRRVDHSALRANQAFIVGLLIVAFVLDLPVLAAFVAAVMLVGTIEPKLALFQAIYRGVLKPSGIVKPDVIEDNPEPHRFAQGFGGVVLALGAIALFAGGHVLGWGLVWLVAALAALNLFAGFCTGCFMYYQFNRWGVPGFRHSRIIRR